MPLETLPNLRARIAVLEAELRRLKAKREPLKADDMAAAGLTAQIDQLRIVLDELHTRRRRMERTSDSGDGPPRG